MWRLYVVSSASTRMRPGSARLIARTNVSSSTPSRLGNVSWSGAYQCSQKGRLRPTRFSQVRLCDSLTPSDGAPARGERSSVSAIPWA